MIEYRPVETCCGERPSFSLLNQEMSNHFSACRGGLPEAPLIDWVWSIAGHTGSLLVDVGSHVGSWTLPFACAGMRVDAFEPNDAIWPLLHDAIGKNDLTFTARLHPVALSDHQGTATLTAPGVDGGMGSIVRSFSGPVSQAVSVTTLDSFQLAPSIIKIDVEGAEVDVLRGATQTIHEHRPLIFFECWEAELGQRRPELFQYVESDMGYGLFATAWPEMWMAVPLECCED